MNFRGFVLGALSLAGSAVSPAVAQLIHVSVDMPDGGLIFKTDDASIPWNQSVGFITQFDFTFNSQEKAGALDPGRNYWRMRVENSSLGRNFVITKPLQTVTAWDQGLTFSYSNFEHNAFEEFDLLMVFDSPIATDGSLPKFPLPALGATEFTQSGMSLFAGRSLFNVPHLTEAYGGIGINSVTVTMTPIPEPSVYGLAALAVAGVAIGLRRKKQISAALA
jgi:hypothetical protein